MKTTKTQRDEASSRYYNGEKIKELGDEYGVHGSTIIGWAKCRNLIRRNRPCTYDVNSSYFDIIDSEDKAYWLGFLAADGCVTDKQTLELTLMAQDKSHIEKLRFSLESNHPIVDMPYKNQSKIVIGRKDLCNGLRRHGIVERKTFSIEYPDIPNEMDPHFIRGVFDGDGTWVILKRKNRPTNKLRFSIASASLGFLETIKKKINTYCNTPDLGTIKKIGKSRCYYLIYNGNRQCSKIYQYLWKEHTICLVRKNQKVLDSDLLACR